MEAELIAWLRKRLPPHPLLRLGPGDDAAVLRMAGVEECVVTVDMLTDHVDFELARDDPRRVGRKCLAVNLSDLAAMASRPLAAVIAVVLPRQGGMELAVELRGPAAAGRALRRGHRRRRRQRLGRPAGRERDAAGPGDGAGTALPRRRTPRRPNRRHRSVRRQHPRPPFRLRAPRCRGPLLERPLRVARRHRRQRRAGRRSLSRGGGERLRGGRPNRRRADQCGRPAAGRRSGRRPHGAGPRAGRRRGFRIDPGGAARRGPANARRAAAGSAAGRDRGICRRARPMAAVWPGSADARCPSAAGNTASIDRRGTLHLPGRRRSCHRRAGGGPGPRPARRLDGRLVRHAGGGQDATGPGDRDRRRRRSPQRCQPHVRAHSRVRRSSARLSRQRLPPPRRGRIPPARSRGILRGPGPGAHRMGRPRAGLRCPRSAWKSTSR